MIPGVLAHQIEQGLEEFLKTTFPPADTVFSDFLSDLFSEKHFYQGPFVSLALPFTPAEKAEGHFRDITVPFRAHRHQESAFERLRAVRREIQRCRRLL